MNTYGTLFFTYKGKKYELKVLQGTNNKNPEYADYLSIPFYDATNNVETYGGGRYMGVREHELKDGKLIIDFNRAYNPSCAYSKGYSCLIPPASNRLPFRVEAGVEMGWKTK